MKYKAAKNINNQNLIFNNSFNHFINPSTRRFP